MMRPIVIIGLCALLGGLIYSQRQMFTQTLKEWGLVHSETVMVNTGPSLRELLSKGQIFIKNGDLDQAESVFLQAIALDSLAAEPYAHMGLSRSSQKKYDEALAYWLKAVKNDPEDIGYRVNLGRAYAQVGQKDEALAQWKAVLEKDPYHKTAQELIAKVAGE